MFTVIILAAGSGSRMNLGFNKMKMQIEDSLLIEKALKIFEDDADFLEIIVVVSHNDLVFFTDLLTNQKIKIVTGGNERQDSVFNGLQQVTTKHVFVHDGARPFVTQAIINNIKQELLNGEDAVICAIKSKDSVRTIKDGYIDQIIDRESIVLVQTPQAATTSALKKAHLLAQKLAIFGTDECSLLQAAEYQVKVVTGAQKNIKITTIDDVL